MIVHSSLLVQSKHPDRAVRSCSKTEDQLPMFLLKEWQEYHYGTILVNKTLILSHGGNCLQLTFNELDWKMHVGYPAHPHASYEKADTLLAFHASIVGKCSGNEHAYQFRACEEHLRADLAEQVLKAKSPRMAKHIASQIKDQDPTSNWNLIKYDVMREVLMAKINTNPDIKSYLYETGDKQLVEASANDLYWGSGLPFNITVTTTPDKYPAEKYARKIIKRYTV